MEYTGLVQAGKTQGRGGVGVMKEEACQLSLHMVILAEPLLSASFSSTFSLQLWNYMILAVRIVAVSLLTKLKQKQKTKSNTFYLP